MQEEPGGAHPAQSSMREDPEAQWPSGMGVGSSSLNLTGRCGMNGSGNSSDGDSSSSGSSCSSGFVPFHSADQHDVLELQIDTTNDHLQILTCTASVTHITGPMEDGKGLLDLVVTSDRAPLLRWFQEGGTDPKRFTLQHTSIREIRYRAKFIIRDGADAPASRCLVLSDLRCRFRGAASGRRARRTDTMGTQRRVTRRMSL